MRIRILIGTTVVRIAIVIWACRTHVPMTSSVERTDLDFKISVALGYSRGGKVLLGSLGQGKKSLGWNRVRDRVR